MTVYYVDYTNGADTPPATNAAWGTKTAALTIDSSADSTHFVDAALTGIDDYINGAFFYNRTTAHADIVADFDAASDTVTLTTGDASMQAGDDYYFIFAWKTSSKWATTLAAGDTVYVRAGTTETLSANVGCTNDGTEDARITVIGTANGTINLESTLGIEAWQDNATARPIINHGVNYYIAISADHYWSVYNLDFENGANSSFTVASSNSLTENCRFSNSAGSSGTGFTLSGSRYNVIRNCQFVNNDNIQLMPWGGGIMIIEGCEFTGGGEAPTNNIYMSTSSASDCVIYIYDCVFNESSASNADIYFNSTNNPEAFVRNCHFSTTPPVLIGTSAAQHCIVHCIDSEGVLGASKSYAQNFTIEKVTNPVRTGGGTTSAKITSINSLISVTPASLTHREKKPDFTVWCPAEETTITVYIAGFGWSSFPTASELWIEAEYVSNAGAGTLARTVVKSTDVLTENYTDNDSFVAFDCTFTPAAASFVYVKVYLGKYEADSGIYVDIKPVVS